MDQEETEEQATDRIWDLGIRYRGRVLSWLAEIEVALNNLIAFYLSSDPERAFQLQHWVIEPLPMERKIDLLKEMFPTDAQTPDQHQLIEKLAAVNTSRNVLAHSRIDTSPQATGGSQPRDQVTFIRERGKQPLRHFNEARIAKIERDCSHVLRLLGLERGRLLAQRQRRT